jgi:probable HAF family extracellular repeat protein
MKTRLLKNLFFGLLAAFVIASGLAIFTAANATTSFYYSVTDLGIVFRNYNNFQLKGINAAGQVVGVMEVSGGTTFQPRLHAFMWSNGSLKDLTPPDSKSSYAYGINNRGQIIGRVQTNTGDFHFVVWNNDGTVRVLNVLDKGQVNLISDINDRGQIVGDMFTDTGKRAFLLDNGRIKDLGTLGGNESYAVAINNKGQIICNVTTTSANYYRSAVLWDNGTTQELGTLGGQSSSAIDINNRGQIIGMAEFRPNYPVSHPFLWTNGMMTDLTPADGRSLNVTDINDRGGIVGTVQTSSYSYNAVLWKDGKMTDLNKLIPANSGWELTAPYATYNYHVNNKGQIVGIGRFNGKDGHAFVLTPTWVTQ